MDCSIGPMVLRLQPSIGLATGGFHVTVIGRNMWTNAVPTTGNTFKALHDNKAEIVATKATGCAVNTDCENKLIIFIPRTTDPMGPMRVAPSGLPVEITVNGVDYTIIKRLLMLMGTPSISAFVPNGAHYTGNVRVTVSGSDLIDSDIIRLRLGPMSSSPPCLSALCLHAVYVSASKIVFGTDPCGDNCNFKAPLLVQLALNGLDFMSTTKYFRFLENTTLTKIVPNVGSSTGSTPIVLTASNMNATTQFRSKFGDQEVEGYMNAGKLVCDSPSASNGGNRTVPVALALDGQTYSPSPDCALEPQKCFMYMPPLTASRVYPTLGPIRRKEEQG